MSVTVDNQPISADSLGLKTVGQLLTHLQKDNRLIVHMLIDGREPDLSCLGTLRKTPLDGHTLYVETAEPRQMALEVLDAVDKHLQEADQLKDDAVQMLQSSQQVKALEKLSGCFSTWQHAQESVLKIAQLLRLDLACVLIDGRPFSEILDGITEQLRQIRSALENRDFVCLADTLAYETTETTSQWRSAIQQVRAIVA
jgi:hypothetical protein